MNSSEAEDRKDSRHQDKFPTRLAFGVGIVQFYNGVQYSIIFTLAVYVVRRFEGPNATELRIGQLAGLLAAASQLAVGIAAWPWGLLSDRIGRKVVVLFGNCSTATCILLFGLAPSYWAALLLRFVSGILDGSLVMTKVMVGETCTPQMQARVMSMLALGDATGIIAGPALGGLLADPCTRFLQGTAICRKGSWLEENPYLLPCGLAASLGLLTTLLNIYFMDETLPRLQQNSSRMYALLKGSAQNEQKANQPQKPNALSRALTSPDFVAIDDISEAVVDRHVKDSRKWSHQSVETAFDRLQTQDRTRRDTDMEGLLGKNSELELQLQGSGAGNRCSTETQWQDPRLQKSNQDSDQERKPLLRHRNELQSESDARRGNLEKTDALESGGLQARSEQLSSEQAWWKNRSLVLMLLVTAWMLSIAKYLDELGPIFVSAPVTQGGLGMPLSHFAAPLTFGGVALTVFAVFGYPSLQRAVGLKMTCSLGLLLGIPGDLLLPCAALMRSTPALEQATIYMAIAISKITTQAASTSSMVIVNSLAPRSQLGSVNGVRIMMAALGKSSGPILGGIIWGLSASVNFSGHHFIGFLIPSIASVGCWYLHHQIPIDL